MTPLSNDKKMSEDTKIVEGVLFRRSIRSSYAALDIAVKKHNICEGVIPYENLKLCYEHKVVVFQFGAEKVLRSEVKRFCRIGDFIRAKGTWFEQKDVWSPEALKDTTSLRPERFNVNHLSHLELDRQNFWDASICQKMKESFCPETKAAKNSKKSEQKGNKLERSSSKEISRSRNAHSGGGVGKRKQGEILAKFFVKCIHDRLKKESITKNAMQYLNEGSGVIDAAGGSGHVSLALSLLGIRSTIIDPRETVGRLPTRDRKVLRKAKRAYEQISHNKEEMKKLNSPSILPSRPPPPIPFAYKRAWFMNKPKGVDVTYRENRSNQNGEFLSDCLDSKNEENFLPVCTMCSPDDLLPNCRAVVALHPDEATESIIDFAVEHKIPFVVVPCCVFSRLFPNRIWKGETLTTYEDLIDYLVAKDKSIQVVELEFGGMNKALWSTFD